MIDLHFIYTIIRINICLYCQSIIFIDKKAFGLLVKLCLGFVAGLVFNSLKLCFGLILVFFIKRASKYVSICCVLGVCLCLSCFPVTVGCYASDLIFWCSCFLAVRRCCGEEVLWWGGRGSLCRRRL